MRIRAYSTQDKDACLAIFDSNSPAYFAPEERQSFTDWLDHSDREKYYVLEKGDQIVACGGIFYNLDNDTAGLAWGMVHRDFHRQGYGSQLTAYRLRELDSYYPGKVQWIETSQHTVDFYAGLGFTVVRVVPSGFGPGLDKYEMKKSSR